MSRILPSSFNILRGVCLTTLALFFAITAVGQSFTKLSSPSINNKIGDWRSTALIDYDNNYTIDLICGNGNGGSNALFVNNGTAGFQDSSQVSFISQTSISTQSFWADLNNNCNLDVLWPVTPNADNFLYSNQGNSFSPLNGMIAHNRIDIHTAAIFDYDGDGLVDMYLPSMEHDTNLLYKNTGNLGFSKVDTGAAVLTKGAFWATVPSDFDNDGDMDIFLATRGSGDANVLLINNGSGWFVRDTSAAMNQNADSVQTACWGDFNNDGFQDLFLARRGLTNLLFKNNGNGSFTSVSAGALTNNYLKAGGAVWGDFDNDGFLDIYLTRVGSSNNSGILFHNNGNETFSIQSSGAVNESYSTEGCNAADLNNDGFLDITNANRSGPITIYLNNGNTNSYLKLGLFGSTGNKSAIGAKVVITTASGKQIREINGAIGWRMQQSFELHFGLGQDTIIDTLQVFWPGGGSCSITGVPVNAFYNIGQLTCTLDSVPVAEFSDSTRFLTAHFKNLSSGTISSYEWDFGDGSSSTQSTPSHNYTQAGKYEVTLKVFDNFCKSITIKDSIEICPDTAQLGFTTFAQGQSVSFIDTSISNGHIFQWDFGDGNSAAGKNSTHTYSQTGTYNVCLYVTDSCRIDTVCQSVKVCADTVSADFGAINSALTVSLSDSSRNGKHIIWDFGDGNTDTASNPTHTYSSPGYYLVCMTVSDSCSTDSTCKKIGICLDTAVANFQAVDTSLTVYFKSVSKNANTYFWDFGDGNFTRNHNPTHVYQQYGTYTVCLTITNDCYTDTICKTLNVCPKTCLAGFTQKHISGYIMQFTNHSTNAVSSFWDFGDGNYSTKTNPTYGFNTAWYYKTCLTVTDTCGKTDTTCSIINLTPFDISEWAVFGEAKIFPNPANDYLHIDLPEGIEESTSVNIFDLQGKLVYQNDKITATNTKIDMTTYSKGVYFVQLKIKGLTQQIKVVKQ